MKRVVWFYIPNLCWDLPSCQVSLNFVQRWGQKYLRCQGSHLVFQIGPKNTNLVEYIEILLPIKFRWILLSVFRGEVENVSANQRQGSPSCFSDRPEKHNLKENVEIMLPVMFRWIPFNGFRGEVPSRKCFNQSEARAAILFFRSARKTQLGSRLWDQPIRG